MPYAIEKKARYLEIRVWGETSKHEVIAIIAELDAKDRGKTLPDLWLVAGESQVPFWDYRDIAESALSLLPAGAKGNKTAVVAANIFHKAQLNMYREEAAILPFPVRVFGSRDEAEAWLLA